VLVASAAAAAATTLVAAIVGGGEQRALLLPVLLLPMLVPTLLASVNGSRALIEGDGSAAIGWTLVLVAEAALFAGLGLLAYEIVAVPE
jgi:ABC-type transport system involved in cytochrome c biogenesis permease component